jgi:hypothetical protein
MKSFPYYALEVATDTALSIALGIFVDKIANVGGSYLGLSRHTKLIIQFFLIIWVLYVLKKNSLLMYDSWQGDNSYGIVFMSLFLASQKNLTIFMLDVYGEEKYLPF